MRSRLTHLLACALLLLPLVPMIRALSTVGMGCGAIVNHFDVRLVNYFLEWVYRFAGGDHGPHGSLWSPPFFYPATNVLAYSETFLAAYPFYAPLRLFGASPEAATLGFQLIQLALTPLVAYFCARALGLSAISAFVAAWVSSWSWVRYYQLVHIQFAAGWLVPLCFTLLYLALKDARPWLLVASAWTLCASWFMSVYIAYFLGMISVTIALVAAAISRREAADRARALFAALRAPPRRWLAAQVGLALLPFVLIAWGARHYLAAARTVPRRDVSEALIYQPEQNAWMHPDGGNLLWGRFAEYFRPFGDAAQEKQVFLGWALVACFLAACVVALRDKRGLALPRAVVLGTALGATGWIVLMSNHHGFLTPVNRLYAFAFDYVPGLNAIRAPGRISMALIVPIAFVAGALLDALRGNRPFVAGILATLMLVENIPPTPPVTNRCESDQPWAALERPLCDTARKAGAGALLLLPAEQISTMRIFEQVPAMTIALDCGIPTLNGYTGNIAPHMTAVLSADAAHFACGPAREAVSTAAAAAGKPVLVYVEPDGPLGALTYPQAEIETCFQPCTVSRGELAAGSRRGVALTVTAACRTPSGPTGVAADPPGAGLR